MPYEFKFKSRPAGETIYCTECKFGPFGMDTCPKRMTGKLTCMMATPLDDPTDYSFKHFEKKQEEEVKDKNAIL